MSWKKEIADLNKRKHLAKELGGKEKVNRQHESGRLTVRERIKLFFDDNSFQEIGTLSGSSSYDNENNLKSFTPANSIIGRGLVNNNTIVFYGDDFTVRGGASDAAIWEKMIHAEKFANEYELPLVRFIEGTGGGGSIKSLENSGYTYIPFNPAWDYVVNNLSKIPVISLALGPVAGLGAARLVSSHYSIMVKETSQVFVAGPPLVEKIGEKVTKEELGGSKIHGRNGVVDDVASNEEEAMIMAKNFLSFMPNSVNSLPKKEKTNDTPNRAEEYLLNSIPRNKREGYDIYPIIDGIVDKKSFFEIGKNYGLSVVCGLARLDGFPIVLLANNPQIYGGGWTTDSSKKIIRILDLAEIFHLPVLHLVDNPGFVIGTHAEKAGTIRNGARALAAIYQMNVPICSIILRKAYGVAGAAHMNHTKYRYRFAWPSGDWGSLPVLGGIEAAYKSELSASSNPESLIEDITDKVNSISSPFRSAEKFLIEDIIDPRETRKKTCEWINLAYKILKTGSSYFGYRP